MPSTPTRSHAVMPSERDALLGGLHAEGDRDGNWFDRFLPWMMSLIFHLAVFLVVAFVAYAVIKERERWQAEKMIIMPSSFEDPSFSEHPGGPQFTGNGDPTRQAAQDKLKELAKSEGWAQSETNVANMLKSGGADAEGIFRGAGASVDNSKSSASVAAYGAPGSGGGSGPRSSFYGTGGNATKIVYILDHSGSMLDNFDFLKMEVTKSVGNLVPVQYFAVVMVSDKVTYVGPGQLQRALPEARKQFAEGLKKERAEGQNDDLLAPFQQAFERAFAMKPELIYFLTDGKFGDGLINVVNRLNKDKKVHVNTIAFVTEDPTYKDQLQQLAKDNGGAYHFTPEKELGQ